jgi:hypothetical protein
MSSTTLRRPRRLLQAAVAAAAFATALPASAATVRLDGVRTTLTTSPSTTAALLANGIVPLPAPGTTFWATFDRYGFRLSYRFPIASGRVDAASLAGWIAHRGGIRFVNLRNGRSLTVSRFTIDVDAAPDLTALVNGDPATRISILDLDLSKAAIRKPLPYVTVANVKARLNAAAASALNAALGTTLFAPGLELGTARVVAHVKG